MSQLVWSQDVLNFNVTPEQLNDTGSSNSNRDPLPDGTYLSKLVNVTMGQTADGSPRYTLQFKISDGAHAGRMVWINQNVFSINSAEDKRLITIRIAQDYLRRLNVSTDPHAIRFENIMQFSDVVSIIDGITQLYDLTYEINLVTREGKYTNLKGLKCVTPHEIISEVQGEFGRMMQRNQEKQNGYFQPQQAGYFQPQGNGYGSY